MSEEKSELLTTSATTAAVEIPEQIARGDYVFVGESRLAYTVVAHPPTPRREQ